jgi:intracellular multiplication protein IcmL
MKQEKGASSKTPSSALQGSLVACTFFIYTILLMVFLIFVVNATRAKETYFVDDQAGNITEVFPLDQPNVTSASLQKWVTQAATSVYTIDFYHYQDNIDALKEYFTIAGYKDFLASLAASNSLKTIVSDNLIVSAVATGAAVILQEGPLRNIYTWRIQVPLLLTYQGASTSSTQKSIAVSLLVTRVPTDQAPKGIGIAQIVDSNLHESY